MPIDYSKVPAVTIEWAIIDRNDFTKARELLDKHPRLKKLGVNFLCNISQFSTPQAVDFLAENGWDVKQPDTNDWTPLNWAVQRGNLATTERLLDHGSDPQRWMPSLRLCARRQ